MSRVRKPAWKEPEVRRSDGALTVMLRAKRLVQLFMLLSGAFMVSAGTLCLTGVAGIFTPTWGMYILESVAVIFRLVVSIFVGLGFIGGGILTLNAVLFVGWVRIEYHFERHPAQLRVVFCYPFGRRRSHCYPLEAIARIALERQYHFVESSSEYLCSTVTLYLKNGSESQLTHTWVHESGMLELADTLRRGLYEFQQVGWQGVALPLGRAAQAGHPPDDAAVTGQLADLLARHTALPAALLERARWAADRLTDLLPHLPALEVAEVGLDLRRTVLGYLTVTLENFAVLPPAYAGLHLGPDGLTPRSQLLGRLAQLERGLWNLSVPLSQGDLTTAGARSHLLEQGFRVPETFN